MMSELLKRIDVGLPDTELLNFFVFIFVLTKVDVTDAQLTTTQFLTVVGG